MSELIQKHDNRATIRWKLFTGASALTLTVYVSSTSLANAEDASRPPIWIELDGQFSQATNDVELFAPPFLSASPFDAASHTGLEKGPPTIWDKGAAITFQPDGSDWVFSASIRYGKNGRSEVRDVRTTHLTSGLLGAFYQAYQKFSANSSEGHTIIDFQAGKDVGLGRFGGGGSSALSAGVRIAQFNSHGSIHIQSQPTNSLIYYHRFYNSFAANRRFSGIGPSLSWNASAELAGNPSAGSITFDWGVNGAVLFGRQRAKIHHQTSNIAVPYSANISSVRVVHPRIPVYNYPATPDHTRSRNVTVPNLGGFAAVSWRYADAKVSMGYRADMFFGAIDGGIDTRKSEDRAFYGPYASISIGLGD